MEEQTKRDKITINMAEYLTKFLKSKSKNKNKVEPLIELQKQITN
jgi:hypothetical protein